MTHVSSNSTLFFKFFLPVFWTVFFTAFLLALLFFTDADYVGQVPMFMARVLNVVFLAAGLTFFYLYVYPLKRVEMHPDYFIVTDYFKNFKYTYQSVASIKERDWYFFKIYTVVLKEAGSFGRKIHFIGSRKRFKKFRAAHPALFADIYRGL